MLHTVSAVFVSAPRDDQEIGATTVVDPELTIAPVVGRTLYAGRSTELAANCDGDGAARVIRAPPPPSLRFASNDLVGRGNRGNDCKSEQEQNRALHEPSIASREAVLKSEERNVSSPM